MNTHTRWLAMLISLSGGFAAVPSAMAAGESIPNNKVITQLRAYTTYAQIDFDTPQANSQGCSSSSADKRVAVDWKNKPDRKVLYATAMLAFATNKRVGFYINGCHSSGVPKVVRISVKD